MTHISNYSTSEKTNVVSKEEGSSSLMMKVRQVGRFLNAHKLEIALVASGVGIGVFAHMGYFSLLAAKLSPYAAPLLAASKPFIAKALQLVPLALKAAASAVYLKVAAFFAAVSKSMIFSSLTGASFGAALAGLVWLKNKAQAKSEENKTDNDQFNVDNVDNVDSDPIDLSSPRSSESSQLSPVQIQSKESSLVNLTARRTRGRGKFKNSSVVVISWGGLGGTLSPKAWGNSEEQQDPVHF